MELALLLPILLAFLTGALFCGLLLMHYTMAHKAASDAALYLSRISQQEMRSRQLAPAAAQLAKEIVRQELADMGSRVNAVTIDVFCGTESCYGLSGRPMPQFVRVYVAMEVKDYALGLFDTGQYGIPITIDITFPYAGD